MQRRTDPSAWAPVARFLAPPLTAPHQDKHPTRNPRPPASKFCGTSDTTAYRVRPNVVIPIPNVCISDHDAPS